MKYKEFSSFTDEEIRFIINDIFKPLKIVKIDRLSDDQIDVDVCLMPNSPDYVDTISFFSWGEMKTHDFVFTDEELLKFRQFLCANGCIPELKDNPYLLEKQKDEKKEPLSEKEKIFKILALRTGAEKIKSVDDLKQCFSRACINVYQAEDNGKPMLYRREDLTQWAKEAFEKGEKVFYVEPMNPNHPYGLLKLVEPKYEYRLNRALSVEEFETVFGKEK